MLSSAYNLNIITQIKNILDLSAKSYHYSVEKASNCTIGIL